MFAAGNIRHIRPATNADQNVLRCDFASVNFNRMRIDNRRPCLDQVDPGIGQQTTVNSVRRLISEFLRSISFVQSNF